MTTVGDLRRILSSWDDNDVVKLKDADPFCPVDISCTESVRDWDHAEPDEEYCECCGHEIDVEPERVDVLVLIGSHE